MTKNLDLRRIGIFLLFAFGIAWAIALWIKLTGGLIGSPELLQGTGITLAFVLLAVGYMFAPALAHLLTRWTTREGWRDLNLNLHFGQGWRYWLVAWLLPLLLCLVGAAVYFAFFPGDFDPAFSALTQQLALVEQQQGQDVGLNAEIFLLIIVGSAVLISPLVNSLFTFGEEFGWRAYLQQKLMPLGFRRAMILMGIIWGLWHAPIIAMGHNYGLDYWGAPWSGILAMTWFTFSLGTILGWLTLRAKSVWPAVIGHAAINGIAGLPVYFLQIQSTPNLLIGPLMVGVLGGLPATLVALYLLWKEKPGDVSHETRSPSPAKPTKGTAISAQGLSKSFSRVTAVDSLDLAIPTGEVFGLLGPNGAGKTTTIRMLSSLIAPTAGDAWVAGFRVGFDDDKIRQRVGILTETPGLYEQLSAESNLAFFAEMYEVQRIDKQVEKYLRMLGLWSRRSEPVGTFSKGMRQKLAIARALLHEPEVLFLDEPTSGLDPEAARLVRDFISDLRAEGRTIVLCTHNLDEADRLCDRVAMFKTRLLALDTPTNLRRKLFGRAVVFHLAKVKAAFAKALRQNEFVKDVETVDNKIIVQLDDPERRNPRLVSELVGLGAQIQFVGEKRQSLEDVYLQLLGNEGGVK